MEEGAAPGQVSVWAAAFLAVEAQVPAVRAAPVVVEARAVRAAEVAPRLMQGICGVRREPVAAERPEEAEVEPAQAAPVVSEVEALELAQAA